MACPRARGNAPLCSCEDVSLEHEGHPAATRGGWAPLAERLTVLLEALDAVLDGRPQGVGELVGGDLGAVDDQAGTALLEDVDRAQVRLRRHPAAGTAAAAPR